MEHKVFLLPAMYQARVTAPSGGSTRQGISGFLAGVITCPSRLAVSSMTCGNTSHRTSSPTQSFVCGARFRFRTDLAYATATLFCTPPRVICGHVGNSEFPSPVEWATRTEDCPLPVARPSHVSYASFPKAHSFLTIRLGFGEWLRLSRSGRRGCEAHSSRKGRDEWGTDFIPLRHPDPLIAMKLR